MSYDVTKKKLEEQAVLYREAKCDQSEVAKALAECLPAVFGYATKKGVTMVGPPYTRYLGSGPGMVHLQGGIPVVPGDDGEGEIKTGVLPGGDAGGRLS